MFVRRLLDTPHGRDIYRKLYRLGIDEREVAESLEQLKVEGVPYSSADCPIANYLRGYWPDFDFLVSRDEIVMRCKSDPEWEVHFEELPTPIVRFIDEYTRDDVALVEAADKEGVTAAA